MNIMYSGDKNIGRGMLMSLLSLRAHIAEPLHVWVLTMHLETGGRHWEPVSAEVIALAENVVKTSHAESTVHCVDLTTAYLEELPAANLATRFTPYCMLRLWADKVEGLPDRILYLDNDVVCNKSPETFYNQPIEDVELVGVPDHYGQWFFRKKWFRSSYLNSGVLLMNMKKIHETGLLDRCRKQCREKRMFMPDQTALNDQMSFYRIASRCYNDQRRQHADTVLRHFITTWRIWPWPHTVTVKPWDGERMHAVLHCHEYDDFLSRMNNLICNNN